MTKALVEQDQLSEIVAARDAAVGAYGRYFSALGEAQKHLRDAQAMVAKATGAGLATPSPRANNIVPLYAEGQEPEILAFESACATPDVEHLKRTATRLVDVQVWAHIVQESGLEMLMDASEKERLREQMRYVPERADRASGRVIDQEEIAKGLPPVSLESVQATLDRLAEEAETIWRRGVATAFSSLDRRFRSHDGFKIGRPGKGATGGRIILASAFESWGSLRSRAREALIDVERVFYVLEGRRPPQGYYAGSVGLLEADEVKRGEVTTVESDYFRLRKFGNGNLHIWFLRQDLVERVNKMLAEYYGAGLGWGSAPREDDGEEVFAEAALRGPARNYGLFPTPDDLADLVIEKAQLHSDAPLYVLEPQAGTGQLASRAVYVNDTQFLRSRFVPPVVDCIEIQPHLAEQLRASGLYRKVTTANFLAVEPIEYDVVTMNPPFDRDRWADHAHHALKFVKPGGRFVAILPQCAEFSASKKARAFRKKVEELAIEKPNEWGFGGPWTDLPEGSFRAAGTNVNTVLLAFTRRSTAR